MSAVENKQTPNATAQASIASTQKIRIAVGIGGGNAAEWFDWTIYATFATFFASQFFHGGSTINDLLATLAVFAVGFVARPIGGWFFGRMADTRGRQQAMAASVLTAAIASLVIGLAPTADQIGVGAAIILLVSRLAQGLAHGGEMPAVQTYVSEIAPRERRGLWGSMIYASGTVGILFGAVLGFILTSVLTGDQMTAWGWRIPFVLGAVLGLITLYIRMKLPESETYIESKTDAAQTPVSNLGAIIRSSRSAIAKVVGITIGWTSLYYVWAVSAPSFAISNHNVPSTGALAASIVANIALIISCPLWGRLSDKVGRRPVFLFGAIGLTVTYIPLSNMIDSTATFMIAQTTSLILLGAVVSIAPVIYAELFPTKVRAIGFGISYPITIAIFGGTIPYVQTALSSSGHANIFQIYMICLMLITITTVFMCEETKGKDLRG